MKKPLVLNSGRQPLGIKYRTRPLVLEGREPPVDPDFKPKWPVLVLAEIGEFTQAGA